MIQPPSALQQGPTVSLQRQGCREEVLKGGLRSPAQNPGLPPHPGQDESPLPQPWQPLVLIKDSNPPALQDSESLHPQVWREGDKQ